MPWWTATFKLSRRPIAQGLLLAISFAFCYRFYCLQHVTASVAVCQLILLKRLYWLICWSVCAVPHSPSVSRCWSGSTSSGLQCSTVHVYLTVTRTDLNSASILRQLVTSWMMHSDTHLPTASSCVSCSTPCAPAPTRRHGDSMTSSGRLRHPAVSPPWWRYAAQCAALSVTSWRMLGAAAAAAARVGLDVASTYSIAQTTNGLYASF